MRARRTDKNKQRIQSLWEGLGGSWLDIVPEKGGEPDALVGWKGQDQLIEVKRDDGSPSRRRLRAEQAEWHRHWRGRPVAVVSNVREILELFP